MGRPSSCHQVMRSSHAADRGADFRIRAAGLRQLSWTPLRSRSPSYGLNCRHRISPLAQRHPGTGSCPQELTYRLIPHFPDEAPIW
jgi:hypothetical protein